jgi:hypothetical protein
MNRRLGLLVGVSLVAIMLGVGAGMYGYNLGVARGIAESSRLVAAPGTPGAGAPVIAYWPYPWALGFGFFPFFPVFPLFFILFWFFIARALFWRGGCYGRREAHPDRG